MRKVIVSITAAMVLLGGAAYGGGLHSAEASKSPGFAQNCSDPGVMKTYSNIDTHGNNTATYHYC